MIKKINGIVIIIASTLRKWTTSCQVESYFTKNPPNPAPNPLERKLRRTVAEITFGAESESNQLIASMVGDPRTKMLPIAAKMEPARQR